MVERLVPENNILESFQNPSVKKETKKEKERRKKDYNRKSDERIECTFDSFFRLIELLRENDRNPSL